MSTILRTINSNLHKFMALPATILFIIFFILPLSQGIGISLTDWDGLTTPHFIGIKNFINFFTDDRAFNAVKNTLQFGLISPILLNIFGFIYAIILDEKVKGRGIVRTTVYMPSIISQLIMGYIWLLILSSEGGVLLQILKALNAESLFKDWLGDPKAAMWVIILVNLWQYVGSCMIIYLAGLQSIPQEMYESSTIDGANYFQTMRYIKIPLLAPSIKINVITNIIGSMGVFDIIMALTGGGPGYFTESLSIFILKQSAASYTGYSTAVAVIMFVLVLMPVAISFRMMQKMDVEM